MNFVSLLNYWNCNYNLSYTLILFPINQPAAVVVLAHQILRKRHYNDKDDGINNFAQSLRIKKDAELLEYTETEALMKEWGFNENVFQNSPGSSSGGFGSPVYLPVEEPVDYPPLGEGLGSTVRTKDGGFLRSMNPLLFKNAKNGGKLIMQVSAPVVLPAAMGSSIMEILQHWASVGHDKMYTQVDDLMPLEDISGKMLQQVAWEIVCGSEARERSCHISSITRLVAN